MTGIIVVLQADCAAHPTSLSAARRPNRLFAHDMTWNCTQAMNMRHTHDARKAYRASKQYSLKSWKVGKADNSGVDQQASGSESLASVLVPGSRS